jgi:uncharacterized repeat protein (TIGR01451 family)
MALTQGDIAFTSFNADEDGWSFVTFADIDPNTTLYFTDNEAISPTSFNTGESYFQWMSGSTTISAGTVIRFSAVDNPLTLAASAGTLSRATVSGSANYGLAAGGDVIYAFLGTSAAAPTTILTAISTGDVVTPGDPITNAGLTVGVNAIVLRTSADYGEYSGSRTGQSSFADYRTLVNSVSNWTVDTVDGVYTTTVPNTANFGVASATPTVNLSVNPTSGTEAATTVITVTATASSAVSGDQTVSLGVSGTNVTVGDFALSNAIITIPSGQITGSITFTVVDDSLVEGTETATLTLMNPSAGITLGGTTTQAITIIDNDAPAVPTVSIEATDATAAELSNTLNIGTFTVTRAGDTAAALTVNYTIDGTATNTNDYSRLTGSVIIPAGQSSAMIAVTPVNDATAESSETVSLTLVDGVSYDLGAVSNATVTISDNVVAPLKKVGGFTSVNGAEIPAFDAGSDRLFVVAGNTIEIYSVSTTGALALVGTLAPGFTAPVGTEIVPNSVATKNGTVAVAYAIRETALGTQQTGKVAFFNAADGSFINAVGAGALPDMLTFTPDGTKVLVANEGEPNENYTNDPEGSISIINLAGGVATLTQSNVTTADFTAFNSQKQALAAQGVRFVKPDASVAQDIEPEYITISGDGLTARITLQENNAIAVLDLQTGQITGIQPLGLKDFSLPGNGLDTGDRDGAANTTLLNIRNQPVFGLYQPDAIASYTVNDQTYYITANEGDSRVRPTGDGIVSGVNEGGVFNEEVRVGSSAYVLDPTVFPNAVNLKQNANLGRLVVSNKSGDTDGDGDFDQIQAFGARSFSIWDASGNRVFDSGDQLEQITAIQVPSLFNSDGNFAFPNFDTRSDNKGPEPEGVVVGVVNNRTYAFIGLERVGDVIVYDVTNPTQPQFIEYINTPEDFGSEGLTFISAADSPTGKPLLVSANEISKTVAAFEFTPPVRISNIQGASHISAFRGQGVKDVPGIVTAVATNGFYLQDPNPDADERTSEGIFVFTSSAPAVTAGDSVLVSGTVTEFRPGNSANNLTITQITSPAITVLSHGSALPTAVILGNGGRVIPNQVISNDAVNGNVETAGTLFDPAEDGIDFYESVEGMRVQINSPVATSPTANFGTSEEIWVLADNGANATNRTARGGSLISSGDFNPERIQIDDLINGSTVLPSVDVGAQLGDIVGVVSYDFNNFEVLVPTAPTVIKPSTLQKEVTNLTGGAGQLTVATFNVENLDPADGPTKFNNLASRIVTNLKSPDIISIEEVQDNNGPTNDSVVDASTTYQTLINAIAAAGGPTYQYRQIDPVDDTNGGEPGGNIRVGFLFNPSRVSFVDRPGGTSTSSTTVTDVGSNGTPDLSASPGLIDPTNAAFTSSRKPLVGEFLFNGQTVYVIGNHFNSKGGDQPLFGPSQPPALSSETQRNQQATIVADFAKQILAIDPKANIVVAGDLNDFEFSNPLSILKAAGLTPLTETLPANERYTYNFQGNAQTLDHLLVSNNLLAKLDGIDVVHVNSEFADQDSDHDPSVARFNLAPKSTAFQLQILHASDFEGGIPAVDDAVRFSAVINRLRADPNLPSNVLANTLTLASGDTYIPGAFLNASSDTSLNGVGGLGSSTAPVIGRGDIGILNSLGIQASAFGNHEFDLGVRQVRDILRTGSGNPGANFPYLSTNLNFQPEIAPANPNGNLAASDLAANQTTAEASTIKGKIAKSTVITLPGNDGIAGNSDDQKIGIVGATTPTLPNISSIGSIAVTPGNPIDYDALATEIQSTVDILKAQGINKIILLSHMQQLNIERDELAPRLKDVDIIIGGGSNTLLSDGNDILRAGDTSQGSYPTVKTAADGKPILVVNTDGNYKYVGRLVTEFDDVGILNVDKLDSSINGAYATDEAGVDRVYGADVDPRAVASPNVVAITDGVRNVISTKDNLIVGKSSVFLNGEREDVRTQETNFGNVTADANLSLAKQIDPTVTISLKNGGGIRDNIGTISAAPGAVNSDDIVKLPTQPNPLAPKKQTGDISRLDIENSLRFNNDLSLITLTAQQLEWVMEHAVAGTRPGSTPGQFPQVSGLKFSFDPTKTAIAFNTTTGEVTTDGDRIRNLVVLNEDGSTRDVIVRDGVLVGDPNRTFRMVTLNFLAGTTNTNILGGDNYPFPKFVKDNAALANRVDLRGETVDLNGNGKVDSALALSAGKFTFAAAGSEQDAFAEYLGDRFSTTPYSVADVEAPLDTRIQRLDVRQDGVFSNNIVLPTVETTPALLDDPNKPFSERADADDPAIYVNPTDAAKSLVLTSVKNGGLRVYDLSGNLVQTINPPNAANPSTIRYNNIDLQYGFSVGGQKLDIAVASDRNNDKLAIFKINPNAANGNVLEDITDVSAATLFQAAPFSAPYSASTRSAYGLALYRSPITNDYYAFVSRRQTGDVAQLKLIDKGNGKVGYELVRQFTVPSPTAAGRSAQTEGMVVDQETGFLYIAQEDVGIWKFQAEPTGSSTGKLIDKVRFEGGKNLVDDAEGLTLYYGKNGTGYLLASSQGDNTFAAYTREGNNDYIGQFAVGNNGSIDNVQESDGADVINLPLGPNFPSGLFVTQDGNNDPASVVAGENVSSNFKFVPFQNIANALPTPLKIDTTSYDPRNPVAQPKLTTYDFTNLPKLGTTTKGQDIFLGGFSGLAFQGLAPNGNLKFVTNTDRGPNGDPTGQNRPFYLPNFQPEIVSFELNRATGDITVTKRTGLFRQDGTTPLTGLPNLQAKTNGLAYTDEIGVDLEGKVLQNDPLGADLEGIAVAPNGDYWMVDEYRPAIYHFDINGKLLDRFIPKGTATAPEPDSAPGTFGTEVLPEVYAQRRSNRGFEAVALDGNKLYAFIQSAIDNPDNAGDTASRGSRNLRILEFDIVSKTVTGEYLYLLDDITGAGNAKTDKIGDAVALGNGKFAVVERDDLATNASNKLIYQIDLAGATNINNPANFTLPAGKTIEQLTPAELANAKIAPVSKSLIVNAAQLGYTGVEKLEGLALVAPNTLALINDNDFNISGSSPTERLGILELPKNLDVTPTTADLELSQTVDKTAPQVGDTLVLSIAVANKGPAVATGIKVKDLLPKELTFVGADQTLYNSQTGIWDVVNLAVNGTTTLKVTAKVNATGVLKNTAEIVAVDQADIDSTPNNGKSGEDDIASTSITAAPGVTLKGFASLPADTFADGPPSGSAVVNPTNGKTTPFPKQPVQGFSGVQVADANSFYFMPDNGFGAKGNSADFLLRVYKVDPSFRGSEPNGDGSVNVQSFIQLSDPDKKVPFKIVNEGTGDRLLTGADFDIESFNIAADGTLWFGEEFGPYVLHTDATGKLLEAPIPTPNAPKLNTLNGQIPIVIGHRGASGELPEHTLGAYKRAIEQGADFIEPDLVSTKDGILIARHEPNLINTTDVASRPEFANRKTTKLVDGIAEEGFFASDFTLAEIKTIRAIMPQGFRTQVFNGLYEIPTLEEIIALVKQTEADTGRKIGIYLETKHPTFHDDLGLSLEEPLLATLQKTGFTDPDRIFIQSFEVSNLKELNQKTDLPLVQLLDAYDVGLDGSLIYESVNKQPYDFTTKGDPRTYADLQTPEGLKEISTYADGIGPWKRMIVSVKGVDANGDGQADDVNGDGAVNDADKTTTAPTSLVQDAHAVDLLVHPYTFRNEGRFLASNYGGDPAQEFSQFINLGVDGYFTDFPATGDLVRDQITDPFVRSPQNPDVLQKTIFNTLDGNAPLVIGHRGASGSRPEHTLEAYKLAIADGADFIEPDLVATKDGILIARHENALAVLNADGSINRTDTGTDIATRPEFADRKTTKVIDGRTITGWFTEDLTLAEIKTLNAIERLPDLRGTRFDGDKLKVPTLTEIIDLVKQVEKDTGRKIGIYPETKHPTFFATEGTRLDGTKINANLGKLLVDTLVANNFTDPKRIFIQSFEVGNLQELNNVIMPAAGIDIPLVQLFGGATDKPYDFRVSGDPRTYGDLTKPAELANIAKYAAGIGPNKRLIVPANTVDLNNDGKADDLNGDGQISDADRILGTPTTLVQDAHAAGLQVHPYTFRNEGFFLASDYKGDPKKEFEQFIALGVDAYFTDFPGTGDLVRDQFVGKPAVANLGGSRGFEGMAISLDKKTLYPLLEGTVVGDPANALRVYKFDVASAKFEGLLGYYRKENPANAIGDFTVINQNEYLVIERDNNQGAAAKFKKIFKVDLSRKDKDGYFTKEEVVDLLNIKDPNDLNQDGSSQFVFPFQTIESIVVLDANTLLVGNDNNYPFSIGRPPAIDNNEIIQLSLSKPLNLATPVLSVVAEPTTATEADSKAGIFRVTRVANTSTAQTFRYTLSGTAANGVDYANLTGTATIEAGQTSIEIKVIPVDDTVFELNETVSLKLGSGTGYTVDLALANATVTILDNDVDQPTVSPVGTPGNDDLFAKPGSPFDGQNDIVFTGAGDDTVDLVTVSASPTAGNNRINTGSGGDTIFANKNDRLFGGDGSDTFDATDSQGGNRMSGGAGDDVFFLGKGDRALGGEGNDKFYVQTGSDNLLSGGAGNDQFWIVNAEIPSAANIVLDFQIGTDVIGFSGAASLGISATTIKLNQVGTDTAILFGSQPLATLSGIQATDLTPNNSNQFVFV